MEKRYEIKFPVNHNEMVEVLYFLKKNKFYKSYPSRYINSLYFDTSDNKSISYNLAGLSNRHKVRLRWYDDNQIQPLLEVKSREGRIVYKQKIKMDLLSIKYINKSNLYEIRKSIFKYIIYQKKFDLRLINFYFPNILVHYNREYYELNKDIRLTIDKDIKFKNISLNKKINYYKNVNYNKMVVELKFPIHLKETVVELVRQFNISPKRHSKYLVGMSKLGNLVYI
jgi:hypothetical protein